jgi:hypothetical protein
LALTTGLRQELVDIRRNGLIEVVFVLIEIERDGMRVTIRE